MLRDQTASFYASEATVTSTPALPLSWSGSTDDAEAGFIRLKQDELVAWYSLCDQLEPRLALERAVAHLEALLHGGEREEVERLLGRANVKRLAPMVLVGILAITRHAQPPLPARSAFMRDAEDRLRAELGDTRAEALLRHRR